MKPTGMPGTTVHPIIIISTIRKALQYAVLLYQYVGELLGHDDELVEGEHSVTIFISLVQLFQY